METEKNFAKGVPSDVLERYLESRKVIDKRMIDICSLSKILRRFEPEEDDSDDLDALIVAFLGEKLERDILTIAFTLDQFMCTAEAKVILQPSDD